jgi:hypothetical protein
MKVTSFFHKGSQAFTFGAKDKDQGKRWGFLPKGITALVKASNPVALLF